MERLFIQTDDFAGQMEDFKNPGDLLVDIEQEVLKDLRKLPSDRDIIQGTGGFTKVRVAFKSERRSKRDSARVIYLDCPIPKITFLMMIYSKSKIENISDADKSALKQIGKEMKSWQPNARK